MNSVAVITARGGSKRIPGKNIRLFRGKPIIAYSIQTALASGLFDQVMVSTDDDKIADIAVQYGAQVPFMRSTETAGDYAGTADVMVEVLQQLQQKNMQFEYACCIYPTAPLLSSHNLAEAYHLLKSKNFDTVFPVCAFGYPLKRALEINSDGNVSMIWPENLTTRSQDLPPAYHDAGQFYWLHIEKFLMEKKLFTAQSGAIVLDEMHVQDIDNEADWKIAEIKHSMLFGE